MPNKYPIYSDYPNQSLQDIVFDKIILLKGTEVELDTKNAGASAMEVGELAINTDRKEINHRFGANDLRRIPFPAPTENRNTTAIDFQMGRSSDAQSATGNYSVIVGGSNNIASGNYSSILGGDSNSTNDKSNTFILGSNITAPQSDFTFVNNLSTSGEVYAKKVYGDGSSLTGIQLVDTGVRELTANWQNTYTTVSSYSASWGNNVSEPLTAIDVIFQTNSNYFALPEHSGKILHFDTNVGPLTAFFNEPLPEGFNLGVVVRANNPVTIKSSNSTILSQGDTLLFFLDKAFVYKEPVSNSLIALGDLV